MRHLGQRRGRRRAQPLRRRIRADEVRKLRLQLAHSRAPARHSRRPKSRARPGRDRAGRDARSPSPAASAGWRLPLRSFHPRQQLRHLRHAVHVPRRPLLDRRQLQLRLADARRHRTRRSAAGRAPCARPCTSRASSSIACDRLLVDEMGHHPARLVVVERDCSATASAISSALRTIDRHRLAEIVVEPAAPTASAPSLRQDRCRTADCRC